MKKKLLILLYLLIPFVPYFGTIDKIGSQWLFFSVLNLICFLFFFKSNSYSHFFFSLFRYKFFKSYIIFIILSFISIFYSQNYTLSFVDFSRIITTLFLFVNFTYLFYDSKIKLDQIIVVILIIDLFVISYSFIPLIEFILDNSFALIDFNSVPNSLRGPTGNKNILASYLVFNVPFAFYLLSLNKTFYNILSSLTIFLTTITIVLLSSRASIISLFFISFLFFIYFIITFKKYNFTPLLFISLSFASSFFISKIFIPTSFNVVDKVQSIQATDTSTNYRVILWENAIDYISINPFIGCGIGNWKIQSLPYWKDRLTGYTIPYHAHNDFLELTTETGIIGGLSYLLIFILIFFLIISNFKKSSLFSLLLFALLVIYCFDALVNFPFERAISQLNFVLLMFFSIYLSKSNESNLI